MSNSKNVGVKLFINSEGELRCGWRILAFFFVLIILTTLFGGLLAGAGILFPQIKEILPGGAVPDTFTPYKAVIALGVERIMLFVATLIASAICARLLERRTLESVGYKFHRGWLRDFWLGSAVGTATLCLAVAVAMSAGAVSFTRQQGSTTILIINFALLFVVFLIAGAFEEILIRGFAFQAITHNLGPVVALISTSVLFGVLHAANPNVTALSTVNTMLAGVWLGAAYLVTRSLWLATALHYSWNLVMAFVFGLPVSGLTVYKSLTLLDGQGSNPVWISGGDYGPEGGIGATLALIICTLIVWKSGLFKPSEDMLAAIKHNSLNSQTESIIPQGDIKASN
jgi:membrane protease YdiL (CAAX protease family)